MSMGESFDRLMEYICLRRNRSSTRAYDRVNQILEQAPRISDYQAQTGDKVTWQHFIERVRNAGEDMKEINEMGLSRRVEYFLNLGDPMLAPMTVHSIRQLAECGERMDQMLTGLKPDPSWPAAAYIAHLVLTQAKDARGQARVRGYLPNVISLSEESRTSNLEQISPDRSENGIAKTVTRLTISLALAEK